jgi:hypothetical protein
VGLKFSSGSPKHSPFPAPQHADDAGAGALQASVVRLAHQGIVPFFSAYRLKMYGLSRLQLSRRLVVICAGARNGEPRRN